MLTLTILCEQVIFVVIFVIKSAIATILMYIRVYLAFIHIYQIYRIYRIYRSGYIHIGQGCVIDNHNTKLDKLGSKISIFLRTTTNMGSPNGPLDDDTRYEKNLSLLIRYIKNSRISLCGSAPPWTGTGCDFLLQRPY